MAVYAHEYRGGHGNWSEGIVKAKRGNVIYDIIVNGDIWVRHKNQLRPRLATSPAANEQSIPMDVILEAFDIPQSSESGAVSSDCEKETPSIPQTRRSQRARQRTKRIQLNPRAQRYE